MAHIYTRINSATLRCDVRVGDNLSTTDNRSFPFDNIHRDGSVATIYNMTVRNWPGAPDGRTEWVPRLCQPCELKVRA